MEDGEKERERERKYEGVHDSCPYFMAFVYLHAQVYTHHFVNPILYLLTQLFLSMVFRAFHSHQSDAKGQRGQAAAQRHHGPAEATPHLLRDRVGHSPQVYMLRLLPPSS